MSAGKIVSILLPAAMYHAGVPEELREAVEHPKKLLEGEKRSAVDKAMFRGFADAIMKAIDEDDDDEMVHATGLLRYDKGGPAKDERPPRAAYARQEMSRSLVDHVIGKAAV